MDVALREMFVGTHQSGWNDHHQRSAHRLLDVADGRAEEQNHGGDHNDAAAHAKETAGDAAGQPDDSGDEIVHGCLMPAATGADNIFFRESGGCGHCHRVCETRGWEAAITGSQDGCRYVEARFPACR